MLPAQSAAKSAAEADRDKTNAWWISSDNPKRQAKTITNSFIRPADQSGFSAKRLRAQRNARRAQAPKWRTLSSWTNKDVEMRLG